jgi:hypothetical protein
MPISKAVKYGYIFTVAVGIYTYSANTLQVRYGNTHIVSMVVCMTKHEEI